MLHHEIGLKDVDLVMYLREFEAEISKIPWKLVSPVEYTVKKRLNHLFSTYIQVHSMTDKEVDTLMRVLHNHRISNQVKNMIVARLLFELDEKNTYTSNSLRNLIVQDHLIKIMR